MSLDISTTHIGICIWDITTKKLIEALHFQPVGNNILEKVNSFELYFEKEIKNRYNILYVAVEDSFAAMFGGGSRVEVTTMLTQVNFGVRYSLFRQGIVIQSYSVSDCRKNAYPGIKFGKKKEVIKKVVVSIFIKEETDKWFPTKVLTRTSGKGTKGETVYEDGFEDIADSYIVGKAFLNINKNKTFV